MFGRRKHTHTHTHTHTAIVIENCGAETFDSSICKSMILCTASHVKRAISREPSVSVTGDLGDVSTYTFVLSSAR